MSVSVRIDSMGTLWRTLAKPSSALAAHALGGRIGRQQLGVLRLQLLQFAEQLVVLGVRDLRLVQHVVAMRVVMQQLAQRIDAFLDFGGRRAWPQENSRRASGEPAARSRASSVS